MGYGNITHLVSYLVGSSLIHVILPRAIRKVTENVVGGGGRGSVTAFVEKVKTSTDEHCRSVGVDLCHWQGPTFAFRFSVSLQK